MADLPAVTPDYFEILVVRELRVGVDLAGERDKIAPGLVGKPHHEVYCRVAAFPSFFFSRARRIPRPR